MEQVIDSPELTARREDVASFIEANLSPVKHLLEEGALEGLDEEISEEAANFEIREVQLDAWGTLWDARQGDADSALIHLATGLGKTSVAVFDVIKFRQEFKEQHGREPRVLFTCYKNEILDQAAERFQAFIPDLSQGFFTGSEKTRDADLTFATLQSLHGSLDSFDPEEFDYIIYDEAHHSKAATFERVVNHFSPDFQLALTATPDRLDGLDIRELFGKEIYSKSLSQALAEGLLVEPDYRIVFDDAVKEAMEADFSPKSLKELRELLEVWPRNELIAKNVKTEMKKLGLELGEVKTIVFCHDIMHAEDMAWLLDAEAYHSEMSPVERRKLLRRFRSGDLKTICVRDMFNEGIDIPDAELLVFLRSTSSSTVFEQQLGRGLRKHEGKEKVSVLDFAANIERILMIRELARSIEQYAAETPLGEGGAGTFDDIDAEDGEGLSIKTAHAQFDFDKLSIDLLKKYNELDFEDVPEGFMSANAFAKLHHTTTGKLAKLIEEHGIETGYHWFGWQGGVSLSPEAQDKLIEVGGFVPVAPEGYMRLKELQERLDLSKPALLRQLAKHEIPLEKHIFNGRINLSLSPDAQEMVENLGLVPTPKAPEGYISVKSFAKQLGIDEVRLMDNLERYDIPTGRFKFRTAPGTGLGPEAQEKVRELNLNGWPMPEGYMSVTDYAHGMQTGHSGLMKQARQLGIEPRKYNTGEGLRFCLSPEEQEIIREAYYPDVRQAPEGYISLNAMAGGLPIDRKTLVKLLDENGIETELVAFRGRKEVAALSPEAQTTVNGIVEAQVAKPAPEGYISVAKFAKQAHVSVPTIQKIAEEHGIEIGRHRYHRRATDTLSPQAQEQILAIHARTWPQAPEGYVSLYSFAEQLGTYRTALVEIAAEHGVETEQHVFNGKPGVSLSPAAQKQLGTLFAATGRGRRKR